MFFVLPYFLEEDFAANYFADGTRDDEFFFDLGLGGDTGVVGSWCWVFCMWEGEGESWDD